MSETCPRCGRTCHYTIQNGLCIQCHDAAYLARLAAEDAERSEWDEAFALGVYLRQRALRRLIDGR